MHTHTHMHMHTHTRALARARAHAHKRSPLDSLGGQFRVHVLGSTLCFTTMTTLYRTGKIADIPFVIIVESSATLVPHIL